MDLRRALAPSANVAPVRWCPTSLLRRVVAFFAVTTPLTSALRVLFVGFGALAFTTLLPRDGFPSVAVPITVARGTYFVDDAEIVDTELAQPIVAALIDRPEIESVDSTAGPRFVTVVASLTDDRTSEQGAEIIEAEIARLDLPPEAEVATQPLDATKFSWRSSIIAARRAADLGHHRPRDLAHAVAAVHPDRLRFLLLSAPNGSSLWPPTTNRSSWCSIRCRRGRRKRCSPSGSSDRFVTLWRRSND